LLDAQFYSRRTGPLTLVGPPGLGDRLTRAMEVFFPGSSTVQRKFTTDVQRKFTTDVRELEEGVCVEINGVEVTAFLVEHACGSPPFALRLQCEGKVLAYTGDTEWTEAIVDVARDADLLIAEALSFQRRIRFHLDYASLEANRARIAAKRIVLTHMGPDMLAHLDGVRAEVAADGLAMEV
jgi:ribonuclease BN (tRNA processing enzyme)